MTATAQARALRRARWMLKRAGPGCGARGKPGAAGTNLTIEAYSARQWLQDLFRRLHRPATIAELLPPVLLAIALAQAERRSR